MVPTAGRRDFNDDDYLSPKDIAEYLRISKPTAIKLIDQGEIIGGRIGNRYRAYFKYVREFEERTLKGGVIQRSLPLEATPPVAKVKKSPKTRKA